MTAETRTHGSIRGVQVAVAAMMAALVALGFAFEDSGPESWRWYVPLCVPMAALWGWMLHRALNGFGASAPVADDEHAVRVLVALPVGAAAAFVSVAVSSPPVVSFALPLAAYWLVAEPLLVSPASFAARVRRSSVGTALGRASRRQRVQRTLRAFGLGLLGVGPAMTLLREVGVGDAAPYIAWGLAVLIVVAEGFSADEDEDEPDAGVAERTPGEAHGE